eukprot:scaffold96447_cov32-Tisochrysis_lutea.AAC.1
MGVGWAAVAVPHVECMISVAVRSRPLALGPRLAKNKAEGMREECVTWDSHAEPDLNPQAREPGSQADRSEQLM